MIRWDTPDRSEAEALFAVDRGIRAPETGVASGTR